jgi:hypothetical protein
VYFGHGGELIALLFRAQQGAGGRPDGVCILVATGADDWVHFKTY